MIESLIQYGQRLSAVVVGTHRYKSSIWLEDGAPREDGLRYVCSCPAGGFCKHLVAVAMAFKAGQADVLDDDDTNEPPGPADARHAGKSTSTSKTRSPNLRAHLITLPKERLVEWLLEQAAQDGAFLERLRLDAAAANPAGVDMDDFRRRIDKALDFPDSHDYDHDYDEDAGVPLEQFDPVLKAMEKILAKNHAAAALLAEYALIEFEKVAPRLAYDSGSTANLVQQLCVLHAKAVRKAKPDPLTLADWVFTRAMTAAPVYGHFPWEEYRSLLGKAGMKRFRSRAEAAWEKVPARTKDDRHSGDDSGERHFLKDLMAAFVEADGDVDARAAIECKDLSHEHNYLELARIYRDAKRYDEALEWAEKGWNAFPNPYNRHDGLREFLATEYRRQRRVDEAMAMYWNEFHRRPVLHTYEELKKQADLSRDWPAWRKKAMVHLRADIDAERNKAEKDNTARGAHDGGASWRGGGSWRSGSSWAHNGADHSRLVEILLWERNPDSAWREAAEGGCSETLWLQLAEAREKEHPADSVPIWRRRVEQLTRDANYSDYVQAAEALKKLGHLLERLGQRQEFLHLMAEIRQTRKPRRTFIAELNEHHLP